MDNNKLSNKERIELFKSSVSKVTTEMDASSVRDLLRQRYLKAKEEEEEKKRQEDAEKLKKLEESSSKSTNQNTGNNNNRNIGKQLARIFRFKNAPRRQVVNRNNRNNPNRPEIDPFDDPNVLFENFGFHNDHHQQPNFENDFDDVDMMLPDEDDDDEEQDDLNNDSFVSLIRSYYQRLTFADIASAMLKLTFYVGGQYAAYRYGFGAPFFVIALLVFICTNLRKKRPGELSAYSVFNPDCRPIPGVASSDQPDNPIVLAFGNI